MSVLVFVGLSAYDGMNTVPYTDTLHGIVIVGWMIIAVMNVGGVGTPTGSLPGAKRD